LATGSDVAGQPFPSGKIQVGRKGHVIMAMDELDERKVTKYDARPGINF
jgi:hypothetical protein